MSGPLFSDSWYRVKDLVPRLGPQARIHRHIYRDEPWYILQDAGRTTFYRLGPETHRVLGWMDGRRSIDGVWAAACEQLGDDAPTQDELIKLIAQLHGAEVLQCDVPPDVAELFAGWGERDRSRWRARWLSPLSIRLPLVDPQQFLDRTLFLVRPLFSPIGLAAWLAIVLPALVLMIVHWQELTHNALDSLFTTQNLVAIGLAFPIIKTIHELGHGYATRVYGGEVHDMGIMLLLFTPIPYVDASSSWAFPSKLRRAAVGAGGMLAELVAAAVAFYVWLAAEPGAVRAVAQNVVLVAGFTTLIFNANPLLRFDGYYIASDLLEIPNLRARASQYVRWWLESRVLGRESLAAPQAALGEPKWFVLFTVSSFVYRIVIMMAILSWLAGQFFLLAIFLGLATAAGWIGLPVWRAIRYVANQPALGGTRRRIIAIAGSAIAFISLLVVAIPLPSRTRAEGVVWIPEAAMVRSTMDGFIERIVARPGDAVEAGELLLILGDPEVERDARLAEARLAELQATHRAQRARDRRASDLTVEALRYAEQDLARSRERLAELEIRALTTGTFVLPGAEDLSGRFVRKGSLIAYVVDLERTLVRAVISQDNVDLVRGHTRGVEVRLSERLSEPQSAGIKRIIPAATDLLPSMALGSAGGGDLPTDPWDRAGTHSAQHIFEVELELDRAHRVVNAGGRVYVRFDHGYESLAVQWTRRARQLFLSRLHV